MGEHTDRAVDHPVDRADIGGDPPCWAHLFDTDDADHTHTDTDTETDADTGTD